MLRFLFRFLATLSLAASVIMAVLDATRTVAADALVLTPLSGSWNAVSPDTLAQFQAFVTRDLHPLLWNPVAVAILRQPGFLIFLALALLFYAIGRRPARRERPFSYQTR